MKLLISLLFILIFLNSCQVDNGKFKNIQKLISEKEIPNKENNKKFYLVGDSYFIEGVEYSPVENYEYNEVGIATFYGKELHNKKTANNDLNKVTELFARHKTLPLPSVIKITNLENGLSLIAVVNDRHDDNSSIIQTSRKISQLLRFYHNKIARVKVEILSDASKQMKLVTLSLNEPDFDKTLDKAPTEIVNIIDLEEIDEVEIEIKRNNEKTIELNFEVVTPKNLYLKIYGFKSYDDAKKIINSIDLNFDITTQNEGDNYSIILGPLKNRDVDYLVSSFISKGYKKNEIILK